MQHSDWLQGRFEPGARLGQGGMAQTFLALDHQTGKQVVIKALTIKGLDNWKAYELFEREAQILGQLHHPRIPSLVASFRLEQADDLVLYLVSEFVPGESFATKLEQGWRLTETEAIDLAGQLLEILNYLHTLQPPVIHRDIKPANLILAPGNQVFLVDFGAVQASGSALGVATVVGTYGYMAPEQFAGRAVPASDLYALGACWVHLLTGRAPAEMEQLEMRLCFRPHLQTSGAMAHWLDKLLSPTVENRYQSAAEALTALQRVTSAALNPAEGARAVVGLQTQATPGPAGTAVGIDRRPQRLTVDIPPLQWHNLPFVGRQVAISLGCLLFCGASLALVKLSWWYLLLSLPLCVLGLGAMIWALSAFVARQQVRVTSHYLELDTHLGGFQSREHRIGLDVLQDLYLGHPAAEAGKDPSGVLRILERNGKTHAFAQTLNQAEQIWILQEMQAFLFEQGWPSSSALAGRSSEPSDA